MSSIRLTAATVLVLVFSLPWMGCPANAAPAAASISLAPSSGPPGTNITVLGSGFPVQSTGTLSGAGVSVPAKSLSNGTVGATNFTVPASASGTILLTMTIGSASATGQFAVTGSTAPAPAPAPVTGPTISAAPLRFGAINPGGPTAGSELDQIANLVGEKPSIMMIYKAFGADVPLAELNAAIARGGTAVLTWEPWNPANGVNQPAYQSSDISGGAYDAYITSWARSLKAWGQPVMLRYAHEMNGNWYPWADGSNGNANGSYVAAYRHVHDLFVAAGATNVKWVWNPNVPTNVPFSTVFPGSQYVDLVALDGYNWGTTQSWSSWVSPLQLFGNGIAQLRSIAPGKRILIGETASVEQGGSKPDWVSSLVSYLAAQSDVTGFLWFDLNKEVDWRIDSSAASANALKSALRVRPGR